MLCQGGPWQNIIVIIIIIIIIVKLCLGSKVVLLCLIRQRSKFSPDPALCFTVIAKKLEFTLSAGAGSSMLLSNHANLLRGLPQQTIVIHVQHHHHPLVTIVIAVLLPLLVGTLGTGQTTEEEIINAATAAPPDCCFLRYVLCLHLQLQVVLE